MKHGYNDERPCISCATHLLDLTVDRA